MLGNQKGSVPQVPRHSAEHSPVTGRGAVIDVRLRDFLGQQIKHRQQHRTNGMEKLGKGDIGIVGFTEVQQNVQKILAHQKGMNVDALTVIGFEKDAPVGRCAGY
ncbi:hypothetical protein SDC9_158555 [bioreactor metagenome]|uniref:Uncharacterized protein n=1 Tax=bioreactor metagenome TaxID=1076179 RepID=A0A645FFI1_9ZZZZ